MPDSKFSIASPTHTSASDADMHSVKYVHTISEAGRLLPSASQWNSTEIDFNLAPQSSNSYGSLPSRYSKSFDYDLVITDKAYFKRFLYISASAALLILALVLLIHFLPHKHHPHSPTKNLTLAVNQALTFFDAQKCNILYPHSYHTFKSFLLFIIVFFLPFLVQIRYENSFCSWELSELQSCEIPRKFRNARWKSKQPEC